MVDLREPLPSTTDTTDPMAQTAEARNAVLAAQRDAYRTHAPLAGLAELSVQRWSGNVACGTVATLALEPPILTGYVVGFAEVTGAGLVEYGWSGGTLVYCGSSKL
jgi:hypothetical protein